MNADDGRDLRAQLRQMDEQLATLLAMADAQEDFLLGALLCDVHAHVVRRYGELA